MKKLLIIALFFLIPSTSFAESTHHYICEDFAENPYALSCTDGAWTFTEGNYYIYDSAGAFNISFGTWYLSATVTDENGKTFELGANETSHHTFQHSFFSVEQIVTTSHKMEIGNYGHDGQATGIISEICITDTAGACESASPIAEEKIPTLFSTFIDRYAITLAWIFGSFLFLALIHLFFSVLEGFRMFTHKNSL